jgi:chorismate mutase
MTAPSPDTTLDAIRREIDLIDDQILDLLERRFAATRRVRAMKASDGSIASSPFRPAREATMLRRLIARGRVSVAPDVLVRLWRVILSASTQVQAPVTLHTDQALGDDLDVRLLIGQHFCGMGVEVHPTASHALGALGVSQGDIAILATTSDWPLSYASREKGSARVIGTLPLISGGDVPLLLLFGHAEPQESGEDETLILSRGVAPQVPQALWQAFSNGFTLTSLPGFLGEDALVQEPIMRLDGARIAGRCPRPIKVLT